MTVGKKFKYRPFSTSLACMQSDLKEKEIGQINDLTKLVLAQDGNSHWSVFEFIPGAKSQDSVAVRKIYDENNGVLLNGDVYVFAAAAPVRVVPAITAANIDSIVEDATNYAANEVEDLQVIKNCLDALNLDYDTLVVTDTMDVAFICREESAEYLLIAHRPMSMLTSPAWIKKYRAFLESKVQETKQVMG